MPTPSEKLAESLEVLAKLQRQHGAAIRARDISRTHRDRLLTHGFLLRVMNGWLIPSRPDDVEGESTAWYASYWQFCAAYLRERFKTDWSLSPEQSLSRFMQAIEPFQSNLLSRAPKGRNKVTDLPGGIHPYMDGNGRIGRFLMNLMMAAGGYPWTVIPVSNRAAYMNALERASTSGDIVPFADFLAGLTKHRLDGDPLPPVSLRS